MTLGIKVGPHKQSFLDLTQTNAPFAEVWFDIARAHEYTELFDELKRRNMHVGLHYWGALADGTWTNIAYPDANLVTQSVSMMKKTIDVAAHHDFQYVNIHPGCAARVSIDFNANRMELRSAPIPFKQAIPLFVENARTLQDYAQERGIVFTVETVPSRTVDGWYDEVARSDPEKIIHVYELPVEAVVAAANAGLWVANDFGHTAAIAANSQQTLWHYLRAKTKLLAKQTRLIHMGFVTPPYNGTDFHNFLDNPLLDSSKAVPNKKQMIELLRLFTGRDDIWILTEPNGRHAQNYFLAQKILTEALGN
ncbi:hypothetical protein HY087_00505 [Candidatus Gottesmanbacteria bacterium]|nr:hypothetical protein [Candidatus Gottesmanbacteria bacterium]MBI3559594.1 hypothetical protein [Candidatus Gottesmanbacteria bacterium]